MKDDLRPDPESLDVWENLPKTAPSSGALPPMTGGLSWAGWMLGLLLVIMAVLWLLGGR